MSDSPTPLPQAPAYQLDGRPVSAAAFYAAACDPRRAVVVEACAGAGKTWMLVSRIVRALLEGAEPQQILAITFTRKAAGEMRTRLADWLREFATLDEAGAVRALVERGLDAKQAQAGAPGLIGLHGRLLAGGRAVEVRTFHAWFSQLLRAAPMDLLSTFGLRPDLELIEDLDILRRPLMRRFHQCLLEDDERLADFRALSVGRGRVGLQKWLDAVWRRRTEIELADAAGTLENSVEPARAVAGAPATLAAWLREGDLLDEARALAQALARLGMGKGKIRCSAAAEAIGQALEALDDPAIYEGLRAALFTAIGTPRKQLGDLPAHAALCNRMNDIAAALAQQRAHDEHQRMVRLARVLLHCLAELKRERGLIDMDDLERVALALLGDHSLSGWVQQRLDARVRHLLIDEFQDTSPLQWHALHGWLSAYAGAGGGGLPSVFIVGDPKQSIYRFRRAEPRVFEAAQRFVVEGLGGSLAACDHTRRNAPEVLDIVNRVFGGLHEEGALPGWRRHSTGVDPAHTPGSMARGVFVLPSAERSAPTPRNAVEAASPTWRDSLTTPRHVVESKLREFEAAQVACAVAELVHAQGVAPGEIFVLSRKRASLHLVAVALQARHLPHVAPEPWQLAELPEVQDLLAVLDVLASPGQALSLARALKSPLFGASDADLLVWAQAARAASACGRSNDGWQALMALAEPSPALVRARELLLTWQSDVATSTPHDLLDRIVHEGNLLPRLAAAVPAERVATATQAVHALLAAALAPNLSHGATVYAFVRALRSRNAKATPVARSDAVQLLTVHGAKGLEARVVFVMDTDPENQKSETSNLLVDWPVDCLRPERVAFVASEAQCPPSLQALLAGEQQAREREEINALYVAMTRARERLVFSRTPPHLGRPQGGGWRRVVGFARPWAPVDAGAALDRPHARVVVLPRLLRDVHGLAPVTMALKAESLEQSLPVRLGLAVHRVLEWATAHATDGRPIRQLVEAAAIEFGLADARAVEGVALRILTSAACAPFFDPAGLAWAGNEVPVVGVDDAAGTLLRIDRLVRTAGAAEAWWVLDYKLQGRPQDDPAQQAQLASYRRAVQALQPGETVRAAFITGQGELIEIN